MEAIFIKAVMHFVNDYANECILFLRMLKADLPLTRKTITKSVILLLFLSFFLLPPKHAAE